MIQKIDTRDTKIYSPLIPALKAFYTLESGTTIHVLFSDMKAFKDMKEFLSEQGIGFREIYKDDHIVLEFTLQ